LARASWSGADQPARTNPRRHDKTEVDSSRLAFRPTLIQSSAPVEPPRASWRRGLHLNLKTFEMESY